MSTYSKMIEEAPDVKELLELSTMYHGLITELADVWNVDITPATRAQAFQVVSDFADQLKMRTLATLVLATIPETPDE